MSAPYPAFEAPHRVAMGLAALAPGEAWLELDAERGADLAEKRRLIAAHRAQVCVELPDSGKAQEEAAAAVVAELARQGHAADLPHANGALESAALLVQEDLCVLEHPDRGWILTAASVCFPTRWDLPSKLGLPLTEIHVRVPRYGEDLAASADRFFDRATPGRVFRRSNWSLVDDPALFQPGGKHRTALNTEIDAHNAGRRVWIRTERQTVQRLGSSGAILFTIRVFRTPLAALEADPPAARALRESLRTMSDAFQLYKSFPPIRSAVCAYLDAI